MAVRRLLQVAPNTGNSMLGQPMPKPSPTEPDDVKAGLDGLPHVAPSVSAAVVQPKAKAPVMPDLSAPLPVGQTLPPEAIAPTDQASARQVQNLLNQLQADPAAHQPLNQAQVDEILSTLTPEQKAEVQKILSDPKLLQDILKQAAGALQNP
ncbi:MAG TPA: hypothetical protein VMU17_02680 [Elusimicrobiota bacterium]|nr:hypothetical protein [Elusimicrobiota bacterium]